MNRPIRVLELRSVVGTGGGPDKTLILSAARKDADVDLTLCYLCNEGDEQFQIGTLARQHGVDYVEIRERGPTDLRMWKQLQRLAAGRQFDIVHGHEYKTDLLAWLLAKAEGLIPFATAHGWTGHSWKERWLYYPGDKRLLTRFPRVAAVSGEIRDTLVAAGADPDRVDVVLNGIDHARFRREPWRRAGVRAKFGLDDDVIVIGAVGRLEPQKRFDLLLEAFAVIAAQRNVHLLIAGEGSLRPALEAQIARLGLVGRAKLTGQAEVVEFHHALDLFVQSSDYEGTPNVVLEAMALETPLVATAVGGTAELVDDGTHGLLVAPGDAGRIASAIDRALADHGTTATRVRNARQRVETDLSFDKRMQQINTIYRELIERRI